MENTAQTALADFEKAWLTINYVAMTDAQKTTHIQTHYDLKIKAAKEIEANRLESEAEQVTAQATQVTNQTNALKAIGFIGDNSQADWDKLYNRPKVFGANWQMQANYQKSISTGVEYFLNKAQEILTQQYVVNTPYSVGETFVYNGQLYEVIQAHTSQSDWNPETTPALYKKAVLAGVIADFVQPTGAHDAYQIGDKVTFNGSTYESLINANVWSPTAYPAGWRKL